MKNARMFCTLYALSFLQSLTKRQQKIYIVGMKFVVIWALPLFKAMDILHYALPVPAVAPALRKHYNRLPCAMEGRRWRVSRPMLTGLAAWEPELNTSISAMQLRGVWPARAQVMRRSWHLQFDTETAGRGVLRGLQAGSCSHVPGHSRVGVTKKHLKFCFLLNLKSGPIFLRIHN